MARQIVSLIALLLVSPSLLADLASAQKAYNSGDAAAAANEYRRLADQGNAEAEANLGYLYYVGSGVPQNYAKAVKWFRKSAQQGNRDAQYNLAVAYAFGEGVTQDYKEAAVWYRRAAEQGHTLAEYSLGLSYSFGEGVPQDSKKAVKWFRKAAEQGYARAQVELGSRYHTGDGVPLDYKEAAKWYRMAADRGDATAQYNLGTMYREGKGVKKDDNQALRWFRLAADQGNVAAQQELANMEKSMSAAAMAKQQGGASGESKKPMFSVAKSNLLSIDSGQGGKEVGSAVESNGAGVAQPAEPAASAQSQSEAAGSEAASVTPTAKNKKSGGVTGFFKRLFSHGKSSSEETAAAGTAAAGTAAAGAGATAGTTEAGAAATGTGTETTEAGAAATEAAETSAVPSEQTAKKPGFFSRLFHHKSSAETKTAQASNQGTESGESPAESTRETASEGAESAQPASSSSTAQKTEPTEQAQAQEQSSSAKRPGFFSRLFHLHSRKTTEPQAENGEKVAMAAESSTEANTAAAQSSETTEKKSSGGFFHRLFHGSEKNKAAPEAEAAQSTAGAKKQGHPANPQQLAAALNTLHQGEYDQAFRELHDLGAQGDVTAQLNVAKMYYQGLGTDQDYQAAADWYKRAAEQGSADAQYSLGNMYLMGEGVKQSDSKAKHWYQLAAAQGNAEAQHNLDNLNRLHQEISSNAKQIAAAQAAPAAEAASESDSAENAAIQQEAQEKPGFFHRLFHGDKKKLEETQAAKTENTPAQPATQQAESTPAEPEQQAQAAPEKKKGGISGFFSRLFHHKNKETESASEQRTKVALASESPQENAPPGPAEAVSNYEQGMAYSLGDGVPKDQQKAFSLYSKAADKGYAPAQYKVGLSYAYGQGTSKDMQKAEHWYKLAAEQGYAMAQRNLGLMLMNGDGVPQNKPLALAWYMILAEGGNVLDIRRRDLLSADMSQSQRDQAKTLADQLKAGMHTPPSE